MTSVQDGPTPDVDAAAPSKEDVQRRIEEILAESKQQDDTSSRRTRAILITVLILLLLLLCGVGGFLYRLLNPSAGTTAKEAAGITWIRSIYGWGPAANQQFVNPNDAAVGPGGTIWVADPNGSRVEKFRPDGSFIGFVNGSRFTGEPFRQPSRLAVDPDGILYVADIANASLTIMDGNRKLVATPIPGLTCVDVSDTMVVIGSRSGFAILDKDGNVKTIVGTKGTGDMQFDTVGGVAIDSARKVIYVVDTYNNRLSAWDYNGKRKWMVVTGNPGNKVKLEGGASLVTTSSAPAALQVPSDVTVDANGRPIVLDSFGFQIAAFDPKNGDFIGSWGAYGDKDGQFMYPSTINYDQARDWFTVADTSNRRVQIIRIAGSSTQSSGVLSGFQRLISGPLRALWPCLVLLLLLIIAIVVNRWRRNRRNREEEVEEGSTEDAEPLADEV